MKNKRDEQALLNGILDLLQYRHMPYCHIRNTGMIIKRDNKFIFGKGSRNQKGVADIICLIKGKAWALECKSSTGRASSEQLEWLNRWKLAGGESMIVTDIQQVIDVMDGKKSA